jgi:hypothetical protein
VYDSSKNTVNSYDNDHQTLWDDSNYWKINDNFFEEETPKEIRRIDRKLGTYISISKQNNFSMTGTCTLIGPLPLGGIQNKF